MGVYLASVTIYPTPLLCKFSLCHLALLLAVTRVARRLPGLARPAASRRRARGPCRQGRLDW